jgi:hypothetical protein
MKRLRAKWPLAILIAFIAATIAAPHIQNFVEAMGDHLPEQNVVTDYLLAWVASIAIAVAIGFAPLSSKHKEALIILWIARCVVTLGLMLAYEHLYLLDSTGYFYEPSQPRFNAEPHFGSGTENVKFVIYLLYKVLPPDYHLLKVVFSFIGLVGTYFFYFAARTYLRRDKIEILYLLGLFPSILFWSSIIGKDPLIFLGLGLYAWGVVSWRVDGSWRWLLVIVFSVALTASLRAWLGPLLLGPVVLLSMVLSLRHSRYILTTFLMLAALITGFQLTNTYFGTSSAELLEYTGSQSARFGSVQGESNVDLTIDFSSPVAIVKYLPVGIFTALFRPLPGEVRNTFGLLAGLENLGLLLLLGTSLARLRFSELQKPIVLWMLTLILGWACLYGLFAYNLGSLSRYKLQVAPVFLGFLLTINRRRRFAKVAGFKKRNRCVCVE